MSQTDGRLNFVRVVRSGTSFTIPVDELALSPTLTEKDFLVYYANTLVVLPNANITKTSPVLLTYSGPNVGTNVELEVRRVPVFLTTPQTAQPALTQASRLRGSLTVTWGTVNYPVTTAGATSSGTTSTVVTGQMAGWDPTVGGLHIGNNGFFNTTAETAGRYLLTFNSNTGNYTGSTPPTVRYHQLRNTTDNVNFDAFLAQPFWFGGYVFPVTLVAGKNYWWRMFFDTNSGTQTMNTITMTLQRI